MTALTPALRRWGVCWAALWTLLALTGGMGTPAWAQGGDAGVVAVPPLSSRVMDLTGTLSESQRAALEAKLAAFEAEAGPQIVVLMLSSTAPEDIASYTQRLGDAWQLGRRDVGDGLLLVVAKDDRRLRIAPAKALEGAVPDLAARQIIDRTITPAFRQGDYAGGLAAGIEALMARIRGENLPPPIQRADSDGAAPDGLQLQDLLIFAFVGVPIIGQVLTALFGRKRGALLTAGVSGALGWWMTASLVVAGGVALAALVLVGLFGVGSSGGLGGLGRGTRGRDLPHIGGWGGGRGGHRGGGGSWGGGGGFRSGGGGNFGGGGASGGW